MKGPSLLLSSTALFAEEAPAPEPAQPSYSTCHISRNQVVQVNIDPNNLPKEKIEVYVHANELIQVSFSHNTNHDYMVNNVVKREFKVQYSSDLNKDVLVKTGYFLADLKGEGSTNLLFDPALSNTNNQAMIFFFKAQQAGIQDVSFNVETTKTISWYESDYRKQIVNDQVNLIVKIEP